MNPFYETFFLFTIYAFIGWCGEVVFAAVRSGKFVNRGFLNGPVCPIYGFGAVIVIRLLTPLQKHLPFLFIGSVFLTSVLEFITGFLLEKIFHTKWWDYSKEPLNLCGYVCFKFSFAWGVACILLMRVLHPFIAQAVSWIPAASDGGNRRQTETAFRPHRRQFIQRCQPCKRNVSAYEGKYGGVEAQT